MKYRCVLTMPAVVSITVEVDAPGQESGMAMSYDQAYAAKLGDVQLQSIDNKAAMLESCEPASLRTETGEPARFVIAEPVSEEPTAVLPSAAAPAPASSAPYLVQYFATPADHAEKRPAAEIAEYNYETACKLCDQLKLARDGYLRCVVNVPGRSVLYTVKNDYGGFAVVVFKDRASQDAQSWSLWEGWITSQREAKKRAMALFDQGRVFAVGVLQTETASTPEKLITTLSRS